MLYSYKKTAPSVHETVFIAPQAILVGDIRIDKNASIWYQTVIRADINKIEIGENTNVQDACLLHVTKRHPVIIGPRVTIGHGAILHGCTIENDCLIAMGAIILDGARIGANSLIAAGSLITPNTEIPAGSLVMGSPGRVIRQLNDLDKEKITAGWQNYVTYAQSFQHDVELVSR